MAIVASFVSFGRVELLPEIGSDDHNIDLFSNISIKVNFALFKNVLNICAIVRFYGKDQETPFFCLKHCIRIQRVLIFHVFYRPEIVNHFGIKPQAPLAFESKVKEVQHPTHLISIGLCGDWSFVFHLLLLP